VARAGQIDHIGIVLLDQPVQVDINQTEARRRTPVAKQPRLDVLLPQRLTQQRVLLQVNLRDGQVVGCLPITQHLVQQRRRQRPGRCYFPTLGRAHSAGDAYVEPVHGRLLPLRSNGNAQGGASLQLDPPPQTIVRAVLVLVDEPHQRCCGRSSSAPKKAAALPRPDIWARGRGHPCRRIRTVIASGGRDAMCRTTGGRRT
jgi:hypothetical protein